MNIVTLTILPILQATQNRDGTALQGKLDEMITTSGAARDVMIGLENRSEEEIEAFRNEGGLGYDPNSLPKINGRI